MKQRNEDGNGQTIKRHESPLSGTAPVEIPVVDPTAGDSVAAITSEGALAAGLTPLGEKILAEQEMLPVDKRAMPDPAKKEAGPTLTFGETLVGKSFNPSFNPKIDEAKALCAKLADLLNDFNETQSKSQESQRLFSHATMSILDAQMLAVKFLTWKF